jgi:hypothetical protein
MNRRSIAICALLGLIVLLAACRISTDLGTLCNMVKRNPDGGQGSVPIREAELPDGGKDFVAFGATECEDLVCVRDSNVPKTGTPGAIATGYCSRACSPGNSCPAANSADDNNPNRKLTCRPLILDEQTLSTLCSNDPAKCNQYFGGTTSPYFCARGTTPP